MKVLVTGGTGFVGHEILRQLRVAGHTVRLLARQPQSRSVRDLAEAIPAEVHAGDVQDAESLRKATADMDAVIHLVGIIREIRSSTFENVHVQGTRNVVEAAQEAGLRQFVHMSALGTRPDAVSRYHQSKWAAEEVVRHSGLPFTIFRPSIIYGPQDQFVNTFARLSRFSPVIPMIGSGRTKFQPIAVEHVASCFVQALGQPAAIQQTYDLAGPDVLSLSEILDIILEVTGRRRLKLPLPQALAWFAAGIMEVVFPRLLGRPAPLNRDQLLMLREDNVGNPQSAHQLFNLPTLSFREGVQRYLKVGGH